MKNKQIWIVGFIGMLMYTPTTTFAGLWGVPFVQITRHISTHDAGIIVSAIFLGWIVGAPLVGLLTNALQTRKRILCIGVIAHLLYC